MLNFFSFLEESQYNFLESFHDTPVATDNQDNIFIPEFFFDADLLKRVFINLITNSLDALEMENDVITIENRLMTEESGEKKISVAVRDEGGGMTDEILGKVFEPYFTTKKEGSGLGLPIIKRIIDEHRGEIFITSETGKGTVVTLILKPDLIEEDINKESHITTNSKESQN